MGYIKHDAIVVTGWDESLAMAHGWAKELGLPVSDIVDAKMNSYQSFLVAPDGSKEGWAESDRAETARAKWIARVREAQDFWVDWAHVQFGGDGDHATLVAHDADNSTED